MTKRNPCITGLAEWHDLTSHYFTLVDQHMRDWFQNEPDRFDRYSISVGGLLLDYSRNRINDDTMKSLVAVANQAKLSQRINDLFNGARLNTTENRPALHTALRDMTNSPLAVDGHNITLDIQAALSKMRALTEEIHLARRKGATGKPIKHIVTIGVGGSYLGTKMAQEALKDFAMTSLSFHFISSVDHSLLQDVMREVDPAATLFIISSKTFSTLETMTNAKTLLTWMQDLLGQEAIKHHFIGVTARKDRALAFGLAKNNIFPLWDFVGGRYSVWSAVGLPIMIMIGHERFNEFLEGAHLMDVHFKTAPFMENMPVILALLSIWYRNFFSASAQAIVPYAYRLRYLVPYLQQADMESNGKRITLSGNVVNYETGPVIFGEEGCNGQHSYHQLLHQGQHLIPVDFILTGKDSTSHAAGNAHQEILIASGISQAEALMLGKSFDEAKADLLKANYPDDEASLLAEHQVNPGNRPSNVIFMDQLTPKNLGSLLAMYEHKIFVQGIIWNINSFDQWGVELGKQLLPDILNHIKSSTTSTHPLIQHFNKVRDRS